MRLELGTFWVKDIVPSDTTRLENGILSVNLKELATLVNEDGQFEDVGIHVVRPGERTRLIHIIDIVEPRFKVGGPGHVFPGFLGPPHTVGEGRTHRLAGVAVVETAEPVVGESTYWREAVVDMSGPGADYTYGSRTINLVLNFRPKKELLPGTSQAVIVKDVSRGSPEAIEYNESIRITGFRVAAYLAEATRGQEPDQVETYELTTSSESLPKVVYFCEEIWPYLYGESPATRAGESLPISVPTLIHPNEFMDGAVANARTGVASHRETTYVFQNHPVINELYRRHRRELNFAGVVFFRPGGTKLEEKERVTSQAANLGHLVGAQGAVLTWVGGGHYAVDFMLLCQKLERMGITTVMLSPEMGKTADESGFVDYVPEADAMVSTGKFEEEIQLPAMERVIGGDKILETGYDAIGEVKLPLRVLCGATDRFGLEKLTAQQY